MTIRKRCGSKNVEWVKTKEGYKLYNVLDGTWHSETCKPDPEFQKQWNESNEKRKIKRAIYLKENPWARDKYDERDGL